MFPSDALQAFLERKFVFRVLAELREALADVVHEELWQLFVALQNVAEKFSMVVVDYVRKFFLERKWLEFFPNHLAFISLEDPNLIIELENFGLSRRKEILVLSCHASHQNNIVRVETEGEVVCNALG